MSAGERQDSYNRIKSGEARLVIGTRSAIFAPTKRLGLVIIDEEHEHTAEENAQALKDAEAAAKTIVEAALVPKWSEGYLYTILIPRGRVLMPSLSVFW